MGARINLMPLEVVILMNFNESSHSEHSMKKLVEILCNIFVRVSPFIFPANFVILDCEVNFKIPVILQRYFLLTGRALVDIEIGR